MMKMMTMTLLLFNLSYTIIRGSHSNENDPDALLQRMATEDKLAMMRGAFDSYVGNIVGNRKLGIPEIRMQDGPQGFRVTKKTGRPGSTTCFPASINIAASWDENIGAEWAKAMAEEFRIKGANMQLAPGLGIARAPTGGRIFEYICGEEPRLCSQLVGPIIQAMHRLKLLATAKVGAVFKSLCYGQPCKTKCVDAVH
jgi:beta-glucosidase